MNKPEPSQSTKLRDGFYYVLLGLTLTNGNISEPLAPVIFAVLTGIIVLLLAGYATYEINFKDEPQSIQKAISVLEGYSERNPVIILQTDDLKLSIPKSVIDFSLLDNLVQEKQQVRFTYAVEEKDGERNGAPDVVSIETIDGKVLISEEAIAKARHKLGIKSQVILWGVAAVYWIFCIVSYYIISNADRYPRLSMFFIQGKFWGF